MRSKLFALAALVFPLGFVSNDSAMTTTISERKPITTVEGLSEYRLDNGLRVILFPDPTQSTVTVNITYFVGSRLEGRGETGMAHLLEHMLFKGTDTHKDIWKLLENRGARFNGTTWYDRTNYYETLPSGDESLDFALKLEADRMVNSLILQSDLDTEMTVVRNEFEMGENSPVQILQERVVSAAYLWHNYGKSTIGSRSDIERVPIPNLRAFYKKYYRPDNSMLVIAGGFETSKALALVEKYFSPLKNPQEQLDSTYTIEPVQDGPRHVELRRAGDLGAVSTLYHISAGAHPDFAAMEVIQRILTHKPSGRLYKALVEKGLAANVSASPMALREPGFIQFLATVRTNQSPEPVLETLKQVVEDLGNSEIAEEELARAKASILKEFDLSFRDSQRIGVELSEWAATGDWRLLFVHRDRVEKVGIEDIRRVAKQYFKTSNRTSGTYYPTQELERSAIPEAPEIASLVDNYKGKAAIAEGESFEPTPENIEKRTKRVTLSNGIKLAMLSKKTRGEKVEAALQLHFGNEAQLTGKVVETGLIAPMLMRGTKSRSFQQIRDELDQLKSQLSLGGSTKPGLISGSLESDRTHLRPLLTLLGEILREPAFPQSEFEIIKRERLAQLESQLSDPTALGFLSVMRRLNPWPKEDVRYVASIAETIDWVKAADLANLKKFHEQFLGANQMEIAVVGDFDENELVKTLETVLGNWKAKNPYQRIEARIAKEITSNEEIVQTPDKQMAMIGSGLIFAMRDDDADYPVLNLTNYLFGGSAKSRLLERLRQKEGLSYGAFSFLRSSTQDRFSVFGAGAICAPANAQKAMTSLMDEWERLVRDGLSEEELEEGKESWQLQTENQFADDGFVARELADGLLINRKFDYQRDLITKTNALTREQIHTTLKKWIETKRLVRVQSGDLKKNETSEKAPSLR